MPARLPARIMRVSAITGGAAGKALAVTPAGSLIDLLTRKADHRPHIGDLIGIRGRHR